MPTFGDFRSNTRIDSGAYQKPRAHHEAGRDSFEKTLGGSTQWKNTSPYRSRSFDLRQRRIHKPGANFAQNSSPGHSILPVSVNKPLPPIPSLLPNARRKNPGKERSVPSAATHRKPSQQYSTGSRVSSIHSLVQDLKRVSFWRGKYLQKAALVQQERFRSIATQTFLTYGPDSPDPVNVEALLWRDRAHSRRLGFASEPQTASPSPQTASPSPNRRPHRFERTMQRGLMSRTSKYMPNASASTGDLKGLNTSMQSSIATTPSTISHIPTVRRLSARTSRDSVGTYESRYSDRSYARHMSRTPPRPSLRHKPASDSLLRHARHNSISAAHPLSPLASSNGTLMRHDNDETVEPSGAMKAMRRTHKSSSPNLRVSKTHARERRSVIEPTTRLSSPKNIMATESIPHDGLSPEKLLESQGVFRRPVAGYFGDAALQSDIPDHLQTSPLCPLNVKHKLGGGHWCPLHGGLQSSSSENMSLGRAELLGPHTAPAGRGGMSRSTSLILEQGFQDQPGPASEFMLQPQGMHPKDSLLCPGHPRHGAKGVCVYHGRGSKGRLPQDGWQD